MVYCSDCGRENPVNAKFCISCATILMLAPPPPDKSQPQSAQVQYRPSTIWNQNFYRIRKKVLAITNKYWIEDAQKQVLGFTKQKLLRIKEDIRIFSDESMNQELFRIKQRQIIDMWGDFDVIDSPSNVCVGMIRRGVMSAFLPDEYYIYDPNHQQIGRVIEKTGLGFVRKYVPLGGLIPEEVSVEFYGQKVAQINQQFKIIGDIWEMDCTHVPPHVDRRVLLAGMILMGMIERERK